MPVLVDSDIKLVWASGAEDNSQPSWGIVDTFFGWQHLMYGDICEVNEATSSLKEVYPFNMVYVGQHTVGPFGNYYFEVEVYD